MTKEEAAAVAGIIERLAGSLYRLAIDGDFIVESAIGTLNTVLKASGSEWEFEFSGKTGEVVAIENF
jgi:hypothetical protein